MVQCSGEVPPVMTQGWAQRTHTGLENHFRHNWCPTTGTFYLVYLSNRAVCKTKNVATRSICAQNLLWLRNKNKKE